MFDGNQSLINIINSLQHGNLISATWEIQQCCISTFHLFDQMKPMDNVGYCAMRFLLHRKWNTTGNWPWSGTVHCIHQYQVPWSLIPCTHTNVIGCYFFSYSGPKGSNFSGRSPRREEHKVYIKNVPLDMDKVSCCSFKNRIYNNNKNMKVKYIVYRNPTISTLIYYQKPMGNTVFLKDKGAMYMCIPKLLELAPKLHASNNNKKLSFFLFLLMNYQTWFALLTPQVHVHYCTCNP